MPQSTWVQYSCWTWGSHHRAITITPAHLWTLFQAVRIITVHQSVTTNHIFSDFFRKQVRAWVKKSMKMDLAFKLPTGLHDFAVRTLILKNEVHLVLTQPQAMTYVKFAKVTKSFEDIWKHPINHTESILIMPETKTNLRIRSNLYGSSTS